MMVSCLGAQGESSDGALRNPMPYCPMKPSWSLLACGVLAVTSAAEASTVVYYNLTNPAEAYIGGFTYVEVADEVTLEAGPRFLDTARIAYYGARFDGDETLTVTVYAMDGSPTPDSFGLPTPGTVLFSETVPIVAGDTEIAIFTETTGKVVLPDTVAIGLQFHGVDFDPVGPGSDAGPVLFDPPVLGSSFDDFWLRGFPAPDSPWALYTFDGVPPANFGIEIALAEDSDGDGISDVVDAVPDSRGVGGNVTIGDCDTGVPNVVFPDGTTINDEIDALAAGAKNHGQFVSGVAHLKNRLRKSGVLTPQQAEAIQRCAATSRRR